MKKHIIKTRFYIAFSLIFISALISGGCSSSILIDSARPDSVSYSMFGKSPERKFFIQENLGDSLVLQWSSEINGSFSNTSVTASSDIVFVSDLSGRVFAFDLAKGKELGELKRKGEIEIAPVIDQIRVVFALNEFKEPKSVIHIYDYKRGKTISEIEIPGNIKTEFIKTDSDIIFAAENGTAYRYNINTTKIWEFPSGAAIHSNPALASDKVIFGNDRGEIVCLNASNGRLLYRKKTGSSFAAGISVSDNTIYCADDLGVVYALNAENGEIKWKYNTKYRITATPVTDENYLYIGNLRGEIYKLDLKTGSVIWKTSTNGVIDVTPLVFEDMLVQPDLNKKVHIIDKNSGSIRRSMGFEGRVKLSPVYYKNMIFLGVDKGKLKAFSPFRQTGGIQQSEKK